MLFWLYKFTYAFRGMALAVWHERSLQVHLVAALLVAALAAWLGVTRMQALLLTICVTLIISAELMNTAIEHLAKAVTREENPHVRDALDVASAGVLAAVSGAVVVGGVVLMSRLADP